MGDDLSSGGPETLRVREEGIRRGGGTVLTRRWRYLLLRDDWSLVRWKGTWTR